jgi:CheY-like chemotaxis protein
MNPAVNNTPYIALVDDDAHSARLLTRMLLAHGSPRIADFADAADAMARLAPVLSAGQRVWPSMIIVDLKAHSAANLEFVSALAPIVDKLDIPVVVMAQSAEQPATAALHEAGAAAVFTRHADREAYRREAAKIVSFWARCQRLDAVGM